MHIFLAIYVLMDNTRKCLTICDFKGMYVLPYSLMHYIQFDVIMQPCYNGTSYICFLVPVIKSFFNILRPELNMTDMLQMTLSNSFSCMKILYIDSNFIEIYCCETSLTHPTICLSYVPQYIIQNKNVHIYVLNGILCGMGQVHCGICET